MKYASIIPLIGGETIAMQNVLGERPEYILSYDAFSKNDDHLLSYYDNEVPYHLIDDDTPKKKLVDISVMNAVCPCAGLSTLSTTSNASNETNDWMIESAKYVLGQLRPVVFWGENAPGLASKMGRPVVDKLKMIAHENGYSFSLYKTASRLHGLCQVRNRTFYFFWKGDRIPVFEYYRKPQKSFEDTVREARTDDPNDEMWSTPVNPSTPSEYPLYRYILEELHGGLSHVEFYQTLKRSTEVTTYVKDRGIGFDEVARWMEKNDYPKAAQRYRKIHEKIVEGKNFMRRGVELGKGEIGAFIGHLPHMLAHPDEDRHLNLRECLHIMGMPRDFVIQGGKKNVNHVCQNVPVLVAEDMVREIVRFLNSESDTVASPFLIQDNRRGKIIEQDPSGSLSDFM